MFLGKTYRFNQSDSGNDGHPIRFYEDVDKSVLYDTKVAINGSAGSSGAYVEITITDSTPSKLFYQCQSHQKMGNYALVITTLSLKAPINAPNFTTSAQLEGKNLATEEYVDNEITDLSNIKQNILTAGPGLTIINDIINLTQNSQEGNYEPDIDETRIYH